MIYFHALTSKTENNYGISRLNSRPKLPFPGNGKGREIWGLYSRESRETGIPAHPWVVLTKRWKPFFCGFSNQPTNIRDILHSSVQGRIFRWPQCGIWRETALFLKGWSSYIWSNNNCPCIKIRRKQAIKYPFKTQSWPKIGTVDIVDNGQFIFQEIMQRTWKLFCCGDLCFY